jgi:hypothetical protein
VQVLCAAVDRVAWGCGYPSQHGPDTSSRSRSGQGCRRLRLPVSTRTRRDQISHYAFETYVESAIPAVGENSVDIGDHTDRYSRSQAPMPISIRVPLAMEARQDKYRARPPLGLPTGPPNNHHKHPKSRPRGFMLKSSKCRMNSTKESWMVTSGGSPEFASLHRCLSTGSSVQPFRSARPTSVGIREGLFRILSLPKNPVENVCSTPFRRDCTARKKTDVIAVRLDERGITRQKRQVPIAYLVPASAVDAR